MLSQRFSSVTIQIALSSNVHIVRNFIDKSPIVIGSYQREFETNL